MVDLKTSFKNWLIKQGLQEKTSTGRPSTVYEYQRRVDRICNFIYKNPNIPKWIRLAEDIYPVLGFHILCKNGSVCINKDNINQVKDFLEFFLSTMRPYNDNTKDIFKIRLYLKGSSNVIIDSDYTRIKDLLPWMEEQEITINIEGKEEDNQKNRIALTKFYNFLLDTKYDNSHFLNRRNIVDEKGNNLFYQDLEKELFYTNSFASNYHNQDIELIIDGGSNKIPPQLASSNFVNGVIETEAYPSWVMGILRIDVRTLKRLKEKALLKPLDHGKYSIDVVNKYIFDNFHKSKYLNTPNGEKIKEWWTAKEACENTGLNMKKIQRLRQNNDISYVRSSSTVYIYYPPDLRPYSKKSIKIKNPC